MSAWNPFRSRRHGHRVGDAPAETPPGDSSSLLLQPVGEQARAEAARIVAQVEAEEQAEREERREEIRARIEAGARTRQAPAGPVHMVAGADGIRPCCGLPVFQVPPADYETENPQLVTCRTSAHDTMLDNRAPGGRPYAPENKPQAPAHVPDIFADIRNLPGFRGAIEWHARRLHAGCECKPADVNEAAGWLAGQYAHVIPAEPVLSWWAFRPTQADEDEAAETRVAA